jgi:predicted DNA-binding transcriptional regulator YafY
MRADRLLSLLMLLQARGRMTARELAEELEVTERTIYRDIDALSAAGIPVYGEAGRQGGYALLDRYRTSLTGLNEREVRALFMLSIPAPLAELGISQELRAALLKLSAALPGEQRSEEERVRQRFYLDSSWWHQDEELVPHLKILYQAVWRDLRLRLAYRPLPGVEIEQVVDPYALVAKAGAWYLVSARKGGLHVHRVSSLLAVQQTEQTFQRPEDFDLVAFWKAWCLQQEQRRALYPVTIRLSPDILPFLAMYFGERIRERVFQAGPPDQYGWLTLEISFESLEAARQRLLGFGGAIEVLAPGALRKSLLDFASQTVALYTA